MCVLSEHERESIARVVATLDEEIAAPETPMSTVWRGMRHDLRELLEDEPALAVA